MKKFFVYFVSIACALKLQKQPSKLDPEDYENKIHEAEKIYEALHVKVPKLLEKAEFQDDPDPEETARIKAMPDEEKTKEALKIANALHVNVKILTKVDQLTSALKGMKK